MINTHLVPGLAQDRQTTVLIIKMTGGVIPAPAIEEETEELRRGQGHLVIKGYLAVLVIAGTNIH